MNVAREMGQKNQPLKYRDAMEMIFQDFSASILRRRKAFDAVKKHLRALSAEYRGIYTASLKVTCRRFTKVFHNPAAVEKYAQLLRETLCEDV